MFSPTILAHVSDPHTMGALADAEVIGQAGAPGEGPFMRLFLRLEADRIAEARFETYGCPVAIACGSWVTQWATGRTLAQVRVLEAGDLERVLGGLPLGKEHCAQMTVQALQDGLAKAGQTHNPIRRNES